MLDGAMVIVDNLDEKEQQEVAIVAFDNDGVPVLIHDFTSSASLLNPYLTADNTQVITRSFGTADFYGAVQYALSLWEENPSPAAKDLTQGFVVVITEGRDIAGLYNIDDVIGARDRDNKRVITVPVGSDIPANNLAEMERLGNGWYYPVPKPDLPEDEDERAKEDLEDKNLKQWMQTIQDRMISFADAFYWIQYKSDQSGAASARRNHVVEVSVAENSNTKDDAMIRGAFNSKEFITGDAGVYFNATAADPSGTKEVVLEVERGQAAGSVTDQVSAITYARAGKAPSSFTWTSLDTDIITVAPKAGTAGAVITANKPGVTQIQVRDTANGVSANLNVKVVVREFSYEIVQHEVESAPPWFVDATFQVRENNPAPTENQWQWITDMKREEFKVYENMGTGNENLVDRERSEVHLRKRNRLPSEYSYTLKTVLMIDNSPSVDADGDYLALIKQAAKSFVNRAFLNNPILDASGVNQQEIAVYAFHEAGGEAGDGYLVQDFTSDRMILNDAIDSIQDGYGPINFYRGMVDSLRLWQNNQAPRSGGNELQQGVLVVLSDGWESLSGFVDKAAVLREINDKQVICVGVADDLVTRANINDLKAFANAGYYSVPKPGERITQDGASITRLAGTMRQIQDEIVNYADSFYWLNYKSYVDPAIGNCRNTTDLDIIISNNANTTDNSISGEFETCRFFAGIDGMVYVNSTAANPWGTDSFEMQFVSPDNAIFAGITETMTLTLEAVTYNPDNAPNYVWSSSNRSIVTVEADTTIYGNSRAIVRLPANPRAGTAQIMVRDTGNNSQETVLIRVEESLADFPQPIAYYPFAGNAEDATGNGYDGGVFGPRLVPDRFGTPDSAYSFDGKTNYIALNMFYGPNTGNPAWAGDIIPEITVGAWVKSSSKKDQFIVSFDNLQYWRVALKDSVLTSKYAGWWSTNASDEMHSLGSTMDYTDDAWHFIVATYDSNNSRLFIDGIEFASMRVNGPIGTGVESWGFIGVGSKARFYNGDKMAPGSAWRDTLFNGVIDDVMIFHKALTPDQISTLYQFLK
jgi:hypothetical protein